MNTAKDEASLVRNIGALGALQLVSMVLPILTMPYLTRTLGVETWGNVAFVQVVVAYFNLFLGWGFPLSATRQIAAAHEDRSNLVRYIITTWTAQLILLVLSIAAMSSAPCLYQPSAGDCRLYLFGCATLIASVLAPPWLVSGLEQNPKISSIQATVRILAVPLLFVFVKSPNDGAVVMAINGASALLGSIISLAWLVKYLRLPWYRPSREQVMARLVEGGAHFWATVWISLYTSLVPLIVVYEVGTVGFAQYTLADKIRSLVQTTLSPMCQALYPRMSNLFANDRAAALFLLKRSTILITGLSFLASLLLYVLSERIIMFAAGEAFSASIGVLRWLSPLPFVISISNILGMQIMLPNLYVRPFNLIVGIAGIACITFMLPAMKALGVNGAALGTLLTEIFVSVAMGIFVYRNRGRLFMRSKAR